MSTTFAALGVPEPIVASLAARGIDQPFPIQAATVEHGLAGRDVCGKAPTGSGKTLAFGIPLVVGLPPATKCLPRALVLAPTRELADQIAAELSMLGRPLRVSVLAIYGGVGYGHQRSMLRKGVDIVVACPGRLEDLLNEGALALDDVERVVLDEADRMADMGFIPAVRRILDRCADKRQTMLFSATLDGAVDELRRKYQTDPVSCEVDDESLKPDLEHVIHPVAREERIATTAELVQAHGSTIVFCRTKRGADRVAQQLTRQGVTAVPIHGDRSQGQRTRALDDFTAGRASALVATDVAARGIHVDDVACVVHYDPPGDDATYVHRSGRTGRAGNTGVVVSLVLDSEQRKAASKMFANLDIRPSDHAADRPRPEREPRAPRPQPSAPIEQTRTPDQRRPAGQQRPAPRHGAERQPRRGADDRSSGRATAPRPSRPTTGRDGDGLTGSVKFFDSRRGFGFILHGEQDLFFHQSQLSGQVRIGQQVRFELGHGPKGVEAKQVAALA